MEKRSVGILSFWTTNENYGQILQLYATNQILKELGFEPYIIRYDGVTDRTLKRSIYKRLITLIGKPGKLISYFNTLHNPQKKYHQVNQKRNFEKFRSQYFKWTTPYQSFKELKENSPNFYAYITGSDMVWASPNLSEVYFLGFGDKRIKKIAYAPSFGNNKLSNSFTHRLPNLICNLDSVSIREESGKKIIEEICSCKVNWVPDPTILLDAKAYFKIASNRYIDGNKYLFSYLLSNDIKLNLEDIINFNTSNELDFKYTTAHERYDNYPKIYPTIEEWLGLISEATYVITNSFHGIVFSIIFKRKFLYIPYKKETRNERAFSLLRKLNLEGRIWQDNLYKINEEIDYYKVDRILDNWRKEGLDYLRNALL